MATTKPTEACPIGTEKAGKVAGCEGCPGQKYCATGTKPPEDPDIATIASNIKDIKNIVVVLSGKGGVGKSLTSMMLARSFAEDEESEVGLLDIDICGPSVPTMTKQLNATVQTSNTGWSPVYIEENFALMSAGFLIGDKNEAVIWRGAKKTALIKQFLRDTDWGELDYLVIDAPPGTSDEHLTLVQSLKGYTGNLSCVVVTTSSVLSLADVRREITFCEKSNINILGIIENMSDFQCPKCGESVNVFNCDDKENTEGLCEEKSLRKLAKLPLNPFIAYLIDNGDNPFEEKFKVPQPSLKVYTDLAENIKSMLN